MQEPTSRPWSTVSHVPRPITFDPPVDAEFPAELRITPASSAVFAYLTGHDVACRMDNRFLDSHNGDLDSAHIEQLLNRLTWYSEAFACGLQPAYVGPPPTNPKTVSDTNQPAMLASLCAAYQLASSGPMAWTKLVEVALCGGVTITPNRAIGNWVSAVPLTVWSRVPAQTFVCMQAAYNASYGLASVIPTLAAVKTIAPPCIATLQSNPFGLLPPALAVARDHAAFVIGELFGTGLASNTLRP
eukprot:SAG31_NODE_2019_length_6660_cov_2.597775_6_plen_244_part_00